MGSEARQGIAALVPRRSLTWTTIMGSDDCGATGFFSLFSFFFSRLSGSSRRRRSRFPSLYLSPYRSPSRSRLGDRGRSLLSRYPRSSRRSSPRASPSSRRFSFQRKPPDFLGRSRSPSSRRRGERLRVRSPIVEGARKEGGLLVSESSALISTVTEAYAHVSGKPRVDTIPKGVSFMFSPPTGRASEVP